MSFLWRCRHSIIRAKRPLIPRGTRGVVGQFDHLPLPLPYNIEDGLGEFLPPAALESVAMEYQLGLLARLTDEVRETDEEDSSVTQVIIKTAPFREKTLAFNYASLALNNSFFLGQLTPNSVDSHESAISDSLDRRIVVDHGGLEQLKSTFSAAALGMFTSGWIWFVMDKSGSTTILPTLGPGTLLVRSRSYMAEMTPNSTLYWPDMMPSPLAWDRDLKYVGKYLQDWGMDGRGNVPLPLDLKKLDNILSTEPPPPLPPTTNTGSSNAGSNAGSNTPLQSRFMHTSARQSMDWNDATPTNIHNIPTQVATTSAALNFGEVLYPLFCISVQEHAWLTAGYGVWGKEAWLREFWTVLNWRLVSERYDTILNSSKSYSNP